MSKIVRKKDHHLTVADYIRKHSPIKKGMRIADEDKPVASYNKIMSKLYLGNYQAAKDKDFFTSKNIKAVLNCSKDIPNHFSSNKQIEYMRIPVEDSLKPIDYMKMYKFFPVIVEYIHKHIVLEGHALFIHCWAGRQRSCSTVAAYLMTYHDMTPHEACKFVSSKRVEAFHFQKSLNFEQSLNEYYKDLKKCKNKHQQRNPTFVE